MFSKQKYGVIKKKIRKIKALEIFENPFLFFSFIFLFFKKEKDRYDELDFAARY